MTEAKMRTFELGGVRKGVRLDPATWTAIDWIAEQVGMKWAEWARGRLAGVETDNLTGALREAVMDELLYRTVFRDAQAELLAVMENHPFLKDSGVLSDVQLESILKNATIEGEADFGGFALLFGCDEHGQSCLWVRNGMRDSSHFACVLPNEKDRS